MYLNTHSYYSLRYGTMSIKKLVATAKQYGITRFALTDINNSTGMIDFVEECKSQGIKGIAGMEFRQNNKLLYIGIAKNNTGFHEINEFRTKYNMLKLSLPDTPPICNNVFWIFKFHPDKEYSLRKNDYIGILHSQLHHIYNTKNNYDFSKLVILQPVTFETIKEFELHKHLRAIDNNTLITKLSADMLAAKDEFFKPYTRMHKHFDRYPQIISNTNELLSQCHIDFDFTVSKNKKTFTSSRHEDKLLLYKLAYEGLKYRYGDNDTAKKRLEKELLIIDNLNFLSYFLITWDIIRYAMSQGFYHIGRGSGANSIVAYCLRITDVDPIELDLYFERFINPKRTSPPDFDIDFSWRDRNKVTEYIFHKYGINHTALLGATTTFKGKSIFRELGKVYGLPKQEIDTLVRQRVSKDDSIIKKIMHVAEQMLDFPNLRTIHAGGIIISEEPLTHYCSLDMPPKGFPTLQWDMYVAEKLHYEKLDILSQRGIGHIKECVDILKNTRGIDIDIHNISAFKKDDKVKQLLQKGETNGCFYIESPAMRMLLQKLQCDNYISLVAASSIIRPGVAKSGMMKEYIKRFHNPTNIKYLHPVMEEQLKETYGVMVYQEDVLKVCHHFADLDLADADVLRRAMSGKYRSKEEFQHIIEKFFFNSKSKGYPDKIINEIWRQIESFAGYSFSKAHSASYAAESFQSLYLKTHYPLEFMVAVINNYGGFYPSWVYFNEAKRWGATIHLPCINNSNLSTSISEKKIYIGFNHIINIEKKIIKHLISERNANGLFLSLQDIINRVPIPLGQLIILIRIGALRFTRKTKPQLLWEAHMLLSQYKKDYTQSSLFSIQKKNFTLPKFDYPQLSDAYDEIEMLNFPISKTSFDMLQTKFRGDIYAKDMNKNKEKRIRMLGELVTIKNVRTKNNNIILFATFLDAKGDFFDTVHFNAQQKKYPFKGRGIYLLYGKISQEFNVSNMDVEKMAKMHIQPNPQLKCNIF